MADTATANVGVLNLEVRDNAKEAASGLSELATALESVQRAVGDGLKLAGIVGPLNKLTKSVNDSKSLANIGTFLKSVTSYYNTFKQIGDATKKIEFNTAPIEQLKAAIGDGLHIGKAGTELGKLRDELGKPWNTSSSEDIKTILQNIGEGAAALPTNLGTKAGQIQKMASALNEYAEACRNVIDAVGSKQNVTEAISGGTGVTKVGHMLPLNLQLHGGRGTKKSEGQIGMDLDGLVGNTKHQVEQAKELTDVYGRFGNTEITVADQTNNLTDACGRFNSTEATVVEHTNEAVDACGRFSSAEASVAEQTNTLTDAYGRFSSAEASVTEQTNELADACGRFGGINIPVAEVKELATETSNITIVDESVQSAEQFKIALQETGDVLTSVIVPKFREIYEMWSEMGMFNYSPLRLMSGGDYNRSTPDEFMMQNTYFDPKGYEILYENMYDTFVKMFNDFGWFKNSAPALEAGESPLLLYGEVPNVQGTVDGVETVNRVMDETKETAKEAKATLDDFYASLDKVSLLMAKREILTKELAHGIQFGEFSDKDVINYKIQIANLTEQINKLNDAQYRASEEALELARSHVGEVASMSEIERLQYKYNDWIDAIARRRAEGKLSESQLVDELNKADQLKNKIAELTEQEYRMSEVGQADTMKHIVDIQNMDEIDRLTVKYDELMDSILQRYSAGKLSESQLVDELGKAEKLKEKIDELAESYTFLGQIRGAFTGLGEGIKKLFPTITQLLSRFKQIAKYRMIRTVLRQITSGISEGIKNVYYYSQAVGTSFAPAMDSAATSLQQMKNSIGAALAPVVQSLIPVLQTVVSWFITLVNYANQFFALLNGQNTWTRALPQATTAFKDTTKAVKGTSNAMKDLLADWDELNIIQSQSGSSGGGGSSTTPDYATMFEEVNTFDDKVKEVLDFINDHLGGLPEILKKAGLILLGWKFSKAFTGFLSTLGKLVAGTALLITGVEIAFGSGFEAGKKGYFDSGDIVKTIVGAVASAIGGSLITTALGLGGAVGFGIGLTIAAIATLVGWLKGQEDLKDKNKWGNLTRSAEEIQEYVDSLFTFDVYAEVDVMSGFIKDSDEARRDLNRKIDAFSQSLDKAKVTVEADVSGKEKLDAVLRAANDAQSAIEAVQALIQANENGIKYTLGSLTFTDENGDVINENMLDKLISIDSTVQDYLTGIGKQLAGYIKKGQLEGLTGDEQKDALALMERERKILELKNQYMNQYSQEVESSGLISRMTGIEDRDTAIAQMEEQKKRINEWKEKATQLVEAEKNGLIELAGIAEAAAQDALEQSGFDYENSTYQELHQKAMDALDLAKQLTGEGFDKAVEAKYKDSMEKLRQEWIRILKNVYGEDYAIKMDDIIGNKKSIFDVTWEDILADPFGDSTTLKGSYNSAKHTAEEIGQKARETLIAYLTDPSFDRNGTNSYFINTLGGNVTDLLPEEAIEKVAKSIFTSIEDIDDAYRIFKQMFQFDDDSAMKYFSEDNIKKWMSDIKEAANVKDQWWVGTIFDTSTWFGDGNPFAIPGLTYNPPDDTAKEISDQIGVVELQATITVGDSQIENVKRQIEAAMSDGRLDMVESNSLIAAFGESLVKQALEELQYNLDEQGYNLGRTPNALGYRAGGFVTSDVNWSHPNVSAPSTEQPTLSESDIESGVAKGTATGTSELDRKLGQALEYLLRIANKNFTVNVNPSSAWSRTNNASDAMFTKVTG